MNWDWDKLKARQPQSGGPPPQIDEIVQKFKRIKLPGVSIIIAVLVVGWLLTGIYIVEPDEVGVVKRFGKMVYSVGPGPHYHLPIPIETALTPKVTKVRRLELGFRTVSVGQPARYKDVPGESLMLTGDENIVDIKFIVQYQIHDAAAYLFNIAQQEKAVRDAAEASIRETSGKNKIDEILTTGKYEIQEETKTLLQEILDKYQSGFTVVAVQLQDVHPPGQVIDAFKDVASAKEDKIKYINDAEGYRNDILPKAKGKAAQIINEAIAYRASKINHAKGDANRFSAMLKEYSKAKEVTTKRLYLETMEKIVERANKIIIEDNLSQNLVPVLPMNRLLTLPEPTKRN
jgi:membrane protease subunit HflK